MKYDNRSDNHYNIIMCISWFQSKLQISLSLSIYIYLHHRCANDDSLVRVLHLPSKVGTKILYQKHEDRNAKRHPPYSRLRSRSHPRSHQCCFIFLCFFFPWFYPTDNHKSTFCWHAYFFCFPGKKSKAPSNADGTHCATPWDKS